MMTMSPRNRANGQHDVGPGGRYCACCDHAPRRYYNFQEG
jgi:hypothetical protein